MLRFAPSLAEDINIENLRIAIFNYILSKQLNEELIIRIEDIDTNKNIEGKDKEILETLALFSIEYSKVLYQSDSFKYHQKLAMQLLSKKKAFSCFCSDEKLEELKQKAEKEKKTFSYDGFCETLHDETVLNTNAPFTIRVKKPNLDIKFTDLQKNEFVYKPFEVDSFVILNHSKTPTYNYACAIDDMLMNISTVLRKKEDILNTPKQIHIRECFNYENTIQYIHLSTIQTNKKDEASVKWLIEEGFLPSAIANYLVLLDYDTPTEIFTLEEAISWFDIKKVSKNTVNFDINRLKTINKKHLEDIDELRLSKILGFADEDIGKLGKLFLQEVSTIKELKEKVDTIFSKKEPLEGFEDEFLKLKECLQKAPYIDDFEELKTYISSKTNLEDKSLFKLLEYILRGKESKIDISNIYPLIKNYLGEITK